jgi:fumarate reductase flavoprotein subunit
MQHDLGQATSILPVDAARFSGDIPVLIIGAGGCGLTAALSAHEHGADVLLVERDRSALGSTAMSTGLIPAAGTRFQKEKGIADSPALFAADMMAKTHGETDAVAVAALADEAAATVEWLADVCGAPLSLVDSYRYPGHSRMRMHGTPNRTGSELMGALHNAIAGAGIDIVTDAPVTHIFADGAGRVAGARITRDDGSTEDIGCGALILACGGFGGDKALVERMIPEIVDAPFFGHPGNKGDALRWGLALGAATGDLQSYQGHGGLAYGRGIPILWAHIVLGGFQVNSQGSRFSNENRGYSEQAVDIVAQPGGFAWSLFDERIHRMMLEFDDYHDALRADCVLTADSVEDLIRMTGLPDAVRQTLADVADMAAGRKQDPFGRDFSKTPPLGWPLRTVKVTAALFHTQGGLIVDAEGRVMRADRSPFPNLFAGGGAARGVSGPAAWGYLAGNGLLTATTYGRLAGRAAARG